MAINLGAEVALAIHLDSALSYSDIESALVDAGFDNYTIMRSINYYDLSSDVQLFVRNAPDSEGEVDPLLASDTMTKLAAAMTSLEALNPAPAP